MVNKIPSSVQKILSLLSDENGLSNYKIRSELDLGEEEYKRAKSKLLDDGYVVSYVCRGGGLKLTDKGYEKAKDTEVKQEYGTKEADLYEPLIEQLEYKILINEENSIILPTHKLKIKGQWKNPDITKISIEKYSFLKKSEVIITTFELKSFDRWDLTSVYEAAAQARRAHEAYLVLEWPKEIKFDIDMTKYRINQIKDECVRLGVGLATLSRHYKMMKITERISPDRKIYDEYEIDSWVGEICQRPEFKKKYDELQ